MHTEIYRGRYAIEKSKQTAERLSNRKEMLKDVLGFIALSVFGYVFALLVLC